MNSLYAHFNKVNNDISKKIFKILDYDLKFNCKTDMVFYVSGRLYNGIASKTAGDIKTFILRNGVFNKSA